MIWKYWTHAWMLFVTIYCFPLCSQKASMIKSSAWRLRLASGNVSALITYSVHVQCKSMFVIVSYNPVTSNWNRCRSWSRDGLVPRPHMNLLRCLEDGRTPQVGILIDLINRMHSRWLRPLWCEMFSDESRSGFVLVV